MAGEIAAHRMAVGRRHGHLPQTMAERHAHRNQGAAIAIMEVEVIVVGALALFDLQPQAGVESFLTRTADPEVALAGLAHLDHALFHGPRTNHDTVYFQAFFNR